MSRIFRFLLKPRYSFAELIGYSVTWQVYQLHRAVAAVVVLSAWIVVWSGITASPLGKGGAHDD